MQYSLEELAAALCSDEQANPSDAAPQPTASAGEAAGPEGYVTTNLAPGKHAYRQLDSQVLQTLKTFNQFSPQLW